MTYTQHQNDGTILRIEPGKGCVIVTLEQLGWTATTTVKLLDLPALIKALQAMTEGGA